MLYFLLTHFLPHATLTHLCHYITFRSAGAILTSLFISFLIGDRCIIWLKRLQKEGQPIRLEGPAEHHVTKKGTPTMGGILILFSVGISLLIWGDLSNQYLLVGLFTLVFYGMIGFLDDYLKVVRRHNKGLAGKKKLFLQIVGGCISVLWIQHLAHPDHAHHLALPFFKDILVPLGVFYTFFAVFVLIGSSNAVNLTDGLDGLAIVPIMIALGCFVIISYLTGHSAFAQYLHLHYVAGSGELTVLCSALIGSGLGFLWFNAPPARIFMGDCGSLACGGILGALGVITKHELVLAIIGGLFVIETLSVILQVFFYKKTGRRIFRMAPIHHHFEKKGWSEPTIVIRFWIVAVIFALLGLFTLKIR